MNYNKIFSMCSEAIKQGKWNALIMFIDACKTYPVIAAFYSWLLLRKPAKTIAEFIKTFA